MVILEIIAVGLYATASLGLIIGLIQKRQELAAYSMIALSVGFGLQSISLFWGVAQSLQAGRLPLSGAAGVLQVLGWLLMAVALSLAAAQKRLYSICASLAILAAVSSLGGLLSPEVSVSPSSPFSSWLFGFHVGVILLGVGSFVLAVVAGVVFLLLQRQLKRKSFGPLTSALPPLEVLDQIAVKSLIFGFVALTTGVGTGIYLAHDMWSSDWVRDPKFIFSIVTWIWFALLLVVRHISGWRGARFFILILIGFSFMTFTFLGVSLYFKDGQRSANAQVFEDVRWTK